MPGVLVDSDVILDVLTDDGEWQDWSLAGLTLLTRDARRYRTYFPKLKLIAP